MARPVRLFSALLLALALPACLVAAPPRSVRAESGFVHAESTGQAARVASILDELTPRVRRLLPDTRDEAIEVWVQRELAIYTHWEVDRDVPAFTIEGDRRIHLAEASTRDSSAAMGHELVHALLGPSWKTLPSVAEEGLADWVQEELHPHLAASMRADHLSKAAAAFDGLDLALWCRFPGRGGQRKLVQFTFLGRPDNQVPLGPPSQVIADGDDDGGGFFKPYQVSVSDPRLYGLGYLLVSRIVERHGVIGLHDLCVRATDQGLDQVPASWLMEYAGLDDDPEPWRAAIVERFGRTEILALGHSLVPFLVDLVSEQVRPRVRARSGQDFLYRYRPRFGPQGADVTISLWSLPDLPRTLHRAWPVDPVRQLAVAGH